MYTSKYYYFFFPSLFTQAVAYCTHCCAPYSLTWDIIEIFPYQHIYYYSLDLVFFRGVYGSQQNWGEGTQISPPPNLSTSCHEISYLWVLWSSLFSCSFLYLIKKTSVFNCYSSLFSFPSLSIIYLYLGWLLNFHVLFYRMPLHMEHKISNTTDFKRVTTRDQWSSKFLHFSIFFKFSCFCAW